MARQFDEDRGARTPDDDEHEIIGSLEIQFFVGSNGETTVMVMRSGRNSRTLCSDGYDVPTKDLPLAASAAADMLMAFAKRAASGGKAVKNGG